MKLRDLVESKDGRLSESRVWGHIGKAAVLHLLLAHSDAVIASWEVAFVLTSMLIAPELLKRWIASRSEQPPIGEEGERDDRRVHSGNHRHSNRRGD